MYGYHMACNSQQFAPVWKERLSRQGEAMPSRQLLAVRNEPGLFVSKNPVNFRSSQPASPRRRLAGSWQATALLLWLIFAAAFCLLSAPKAKAEDCPRPAAGSVVTAPYEIQSHNGELQVTLALRSVVEPTGETRYCYVDENGNQSPTLRVKPGDLLVLKLTNQLPGHASPGDSSADGVATCSPGMEGMDMRLATNLHFHGLSIPPTCHQDDVLHTSISPGAASFEYRFQIPPTQPPGLYWYHPHPHGHSEEQVLGGAAGALIVEGIEHFNPSLAGLPERVLVIRDQVRTSTEISPSHLKPPSHDLSVNFVPVPYPMYPPAIVKTKASQRELWRVLNASADTVVELHLLMNGHWQSMGLVSIDGVPLAYPANANLEPVQWRHDIPLPPGGRAEFLLDSPPPGGNAQLLAAGIETTPASFEDDDNDTSKSHPSPALPADDDDVTPPRWIVKIVSAVNLATPASTIPQSTPAVETTSLPPLTSQRPVRERKLYFSEKVQDPNHPRTSTVFYITEKGRKPAAFDPSAAPNITVHSGDVEDWIIENRSQEIHTFHIHQTHFVLLQRDRKNVDEPFLRDSVTVPYWDGISKRYPSVKLRMDFRNPDIVGTIPYHCHILQHEDGGMMGVVRVLKARARRIDETKSATAH